MKFDTETCSKEKKKIVLPHMECVLTKNDDDPVDVCNSIFTNLLK